MAAAPYTHDGRVRIRDLLTSSNKVHRPIVPADTSGQWSFGGGGGGGIVYRQGSP